MKRCAGGPGLIFLSVALSSVTCALRFSSSGASDVNISRDRPNDVDEMQTADPSLEPPLWLTNGVSARLRGLTPPRCQPRQAASKKQQGARFRDRRDLSGI